MSEGHAGSVRSMKAIDDQKKKMLKNEKQEKLKNASGKLINHLNLNIFLDFLEFELKEDENLKAEKVIISKKKTLFLDDNYLIFSYNQNQKQKKSQSKKMTSKVIKIQEICNSNPFKIKQKRN